MTASLPVCGLSLFLLLSLPAAAQPVLTGKIKRRSSNEVLPSVSVVNRTQKKTNISDQGGNYRIPAKAGDTVVFTSAGCQPDTAFISNWMLEEKDGYLVAMIPNLIEREGKRISPQRLDHFNSKTANCSWLVDL